MQNWAKNKGRMMEEIGRKNEALIYSTLFYNRKHKYIRIKKRKMKKKSKKFKIMKRFNTILVDKDKKTQQPSKKNIRYKQTDDKSEDSSDLSSTDEEQIEKFVPSRPRTT